MYLAGTRVHGQALRIINPLALGGGSVGKEGCPTLPQIPPLFTADPSISKRQEFYSFQELWKYKAFVYCFVFPFSLLKK